MGRPAQGPGLGRGGGSHSSRAGGDGMAGSKVLVTGARGFIGGFLLRRLLDEGFEVTALATTESNTEYLRKMGIAVRVGDLTKPETLRGLCEGIETVFHLAARVTYHGTRRQFYDSIVTATRNLLEEAAGRVRRFVYVSSFCAGGAGGAGRHMRGHREDDPERKTGTYYGDAKLDAEKLVYGFHERGSMVATIVRPSNVIGAGSVWVDGMIESIRSMPRFPLVDGGKHSASLVYVENLVDGMMLAATRDAAAGRTYQFRDDYAVTWIQYLTDLAAAAGLKLRAANMPFGLAWALATASDVLVRPLGVPTRITRQVIGLTGRDNDVDTTRAKQELGWRTRIPYEDAMRTIGEYVRSRYGRGA